MVTLTDNLTGELARFVENTESALARAITEHTEEWLHKSLCYNAPTVYTGMLPLAHEEVAFLCERCQVQLTPCDEWTSSTLTIDGVIVAEMRHKVTCAAIHVQYNCKGKIP